MQRRFLLLFALLLTTSPVAAAKPKPAKRSPVRQLDARKMLGKKFGENKPIPIQEAKRYKPTGYLAELCKGRRRDKPQVIRDAKTLAAVFKDAGIEKRLVRQVDFRKQQLILIAWQGWLSDRLYQTIKTTKGVQSVVFVEPAQIDPPVPSRKFHVYLYAMPRDMKWICYKQPKPGPPRIDPGGVKPKR